ncbi:HRDC domain-containing protein [Nigerium massiliense]|uniref:HRDC domain-containing protein n=1 Tax=Nigerium massiliense TaxID=1522317 RepID=UPI00069494CF|nr:HRDC domain-containing protein [Nigerium massiliense]
MNGPDDATPSTGSGEDAAPEPVLVAAPADGVPPVVDTPAAYRAAVDALAAGTGPLAVDTERAQSFRYSAKAYLIQLRRNGTGTVLLDPVALEDGRERADLRDLRDAVADAEWIIHAATQDLGCLAEVGLVPDRLFDTELAGRLLGLPRVSLSVLTETGLGKTLAKEHSAADWSQRPLPTDWLNYAALDVELLGDLRAWAAEQLRAAGKDEWARQEFAWLAAHASDAPVRREDPWRRTSGIHDIRSRVALATVRELWQTRDQIAASLDRAPGRVLGDAAIVEVARRITPAKRTLDARELRSVRGFNWRIAGRYHAAWVGAIDRAAALSGDDLPVSHRVPDGPPPPRTWANRNPEAHARWNRIRPQIVALAEKLALPTENLLSPDTLRRICWEPPADHSRAAVDAYLAERDARPWQRELVTETIARGLG